MDDVDETKRCRVVINADEIFFRYFPDSRLEYYL